MNVQPSLFKLSPGCWVAWQMIPGYIGERCVPWASPIYLHEVTPLKKGKGILELTFDCPLYANGASHTLCTLQVLVRVGNYLIGQIVEGASDSEKRCVVISHIEFEWIRRFCPDFFYQRPPTDFGPTEQGSVSYYLNAVFRPTANKQQLGH